MYTRLEWKLYLLIVFSLTFCMGFFSLMMLSHIFTCVRYISRVGCATSLIFAFFLLMALRIKNKEFYTYVVNKKTKKKEEPLTDIPEWPNFLLKIALNVAMVISLIAFAIQILLFN